MSSVSRNYDRQGLRGPWDKFYYVDIMSNVKPILQNDADVCKIIYTLIIENNYSCETILKIYENMFASINNETK